MKTFSAFLNESIISGITNTTSKKKMIKSMGAENFKLICTGNFQINTSSRGISIQNHCIINNFAGDTLFGNIKRAEKITITNCPHIKNIEGLFAPDAKVDLLEIIDCPELESLDGLPAEIGRFFVVDCRKLKDLQGLSNIKISSQVSLIRIGRRCKVDAIKELVPAKLVTCSADDESELIQESVINEAVKTPEVKNLIDQLNREKSQNSTKVLSALSNIPFSEIRPSDTTVFEIKTGSRRDVESSREFSEAVKASRSLYRNSYGIIYVEDPSGYIVKIGFSQWEHSYFLIDDLWGTDKNSWREYRIKKSHRDESLCYWSDPEMPAEWRDEYKNYKPKEYRVVIIKVPSDIYGSYSALQNNRYEAKRGVVKNTPEYYEQVARENRQRYEKMLVKIRSLKKNDTYITTARDCASLYERFSKIHTLFSKPDYVSGLTYKADLIASKIKDLTEHINNMLRCSNGAQTGGSSYNAQEAEEELEAVNKIKQILDASLRDIGL